MTPLRQQMEQDMVLRGMSPRTREAYLGAVFGLAKYYRRAPDNLSEAEVQAYLLHLMQERKLAWSSCNIVRHGLRFLYQVTLGRAPSQLCIPGARRPQTLPQILSREEARAVAQYDSQRQAPGLADDHLRGGATGLRGGTSEGE